MNIWSRLGDCLYVKNKPNYKPMFTKTELVAYCFSCISNYFTKIFEIHKIIQQDVYTIIIDVYGNKTIVKLNENDDFDYSLGLVICLVKYLLGTNNRKIYRDLLNNFKNGKNSEKNIKHNLTLMEGAIISMIGEGVYHHIWNTVNDSRD